MGKYILRRILIMIPLLLGVSFLTFTIINLIPGSPADIMRSDPKIKPGARELLIKNMGLDKPWPERYVIWLGDLLRGDLGNSLHNRMPVTDRIKNVLPNTLILTVSSLIIALIVAIPLGVYSALRHRSGFDRSGTIIAVMFYSVPTFFLAFVLVDLFSLKFGWFPVGGMSNTRGGGGFMDRLHHLILPAMALALVDIGGWSSYIRSQMLEVLGSDYIRTARSKGLGDKPVLYGHALRNAFLPMLPVIGLSIPGLFGGAILIESIFAWNGIGRLTLEAVDRRDYTLIMGTTMMFALLTMMSNLLVDVLQIMLNPRLRSQVH